MPRRCSSGSRSVSLPVSARTSHVLPWSMCPAVPTVSGIYASCGPGCRSRSAYSSATGARNSALRGIFGPASGRDGGGDLVEVVVAKRAAVEEQAAVADDPDHRRVADAECGGERLLDRASERGQL